MTQLNYSGRAGSRLGATIKSIAQYSAFAVFAFLAVPAAADFLAYSVTANDRSGLPKRIDKINPKYLVNIEWGQYDGKRARVGLLDINNQSSAGSYSVLNGEEVDSDFSRVPIDGIEALISDTMSRSLRFRQMQREGGQIIGAQYLVQVAITEYATKSTKGLGGLVNRVPILNTAPVIAGEARVGMNFRLIDALGGDVVYKTQVNVNLKVASSNVPEGRLVSEGALGGFYSDYSATPVGQAVIAAVNRGVYEMVGRVGTDPAEGAVIQADDLEVWVNLGSDVVSMGERLEVMRQGRTVIDPETGKPLGSANKLIGTIQVSRVLEKFAIARPVSLAGTPSRGDKVISMAPPPSIEYAKTFTPPQP